MTNYWASAECLGVVPLLRSGDVAAVDQHAEALGATGETLMRRAGERSAAIVFSELSEGSLCGRAALRSPVVVLAGPGKNGGDGYVVARRLSKLGVPCSVVALGSVTQLQGEAAASMEAWRQAGGATLGWDETGRFAVQNAGCVVDAIFGVGLSRPLEGAFAEAVALANREGGAPIVAIDIPSGVSADTGKVLGSAIRAAMTTTFVAMKPGHLLAPGAEYCGAVRVVDILEGVEGALDAASEAAEGRLFRAVRGDAVRFAKRALGHKYSHGSVVVASGGLGATGAARLSAEAALRAGAGLVTVAAPEEAVPECAAHLTSVMLRETKGPEAFAAMLRDPRVNSVLIGPGHAAPSQDFDRTRAYIREVAASGYAGALILDADALTAWEGAQDELFALSADLRSRGAQMIMTPHLGEFARLFPQAMKRFREDQSCGKLEAAQEAAQQSGVVVLLKGPDTVVAAPEGRTAICASFDSPSAAWLATAGSGDVLAGLIAGLAARGWDGFKAACDGAALHVAAAEAAGPGLIAEDLPRAVSAVFRDALRTQALPI